MTCGPFSYREQNMESETELESDNTESEDEADYSVFVPDYYLSPLLPALFVQSYDLYGLTIV
jgi:hypothetical protein